MPLVLSEECVVLIVDAGSPGLDVNQSRRHAILKVEDQRAAYSAAGGFSESLYAGEDIAFVQALKKVGGFVVLKPKVITSGRKLKVAGPREVIGLMFRIALRGARYESKWVLDILYGQRARDSRRPPNAT